MWGVRDDTDGQTEDGQTEDGQIDWLHKFFFMNVMARARCMQFDVRKVLAEKIEVAVHLKD
jgi:hypothetical protein